MKESSTYQWILDEGRAEGVALGREEGERRMLLLMGGKRLGEPDKKTRGKIDRIDSPQELERLAARVFEVESWRDLLN